MSGVTGAAVVVEGVAVRAPDRPFLDDRRRIRDCPLAGPRRRRPSPRGRLRSRRRSGCRPATTRGGPVPRPRRRILSGCPCAGPGSRARMAPDAGGVGDPRVVGRPVRLAVPDCRPYGFRRDLNRGAERLVGHPDPRALVARVRRPGLRSACPPAGEGDLAVRAGDEGGRGEAGEKREDECRKREAGGRDVAASGRSSYSRSCPTGRRSPAIPGRRSPAAWPSPAAATPATSGDGAGADRRGGQAAADRLAALRPRRPSAPTTCPPSARPSTRRCAKPGRSTPTR